MSNSDSWAYEESGPGRPETRKPVLNEAKTEAIATADAHTTNAGLPSYSDLLGFVQYIAKSEPCSAHQGNDTKARYIEFQERASYLFAKATTTH